MKNNGERLAIEQIEAIMASDEPFIMKHASVDCVLLDVLCALGYGRLVDKAIELSHLPGWYPRL